MPSLAAPAKINLQLAITGRRDDGYHLLDSLAVFAGLHDRMTVNISKNPSFTITGNKTGLDRHDNSITRAINAFRHATGTGAHYDIALEKNIPVAAGLGGGSADAAAALMLVNTIHDSPLGAAALDAIAKTLGADVPVCLAWHRYKKSAWRMGGIGDELTRHAMKPGYGLLLVNNAEPLSTAAVFAQFAEDKNNTRQSLPDLPAVLTTADIKTHIETGNDLTPAATRLVPAVAATFKILQSLAPHSGYITSSMTGSGATCFALFASPDAARAAHTAMPPHNWSWAGGLASGGLAS